VSVCEWQLKRRKEGGREGGKEGGRESKAQSQRTLVVGVGPVGENL